MVSVRLHIRDFHGTSVGLPWDSMCPWCFHGTRSVFMGRPRDFHGTSMRPPWDFHGIYSIPMDCHGTSISMGLARAPMGLPWDSHGTSVELPMGASMVFPWNLHGAVGLPTYKCSNWICMGLPSDFHGTSMGLQNFHGTSTYGTSMGLPRKFNGSSMGLRWDFHGISMGLPWDSMKAPQKYFTGTRKKILL